MTSILNAVIADNGDGSQSIHWVVDSDVLAQMDEAASQGDGQYASGDGLQVTELKFNSEEERDAFILMNRLRIKTEYVSY